MRIFQVIFLLLLTISLKTVGQSAEAENILILVTDSSAGTYGYRNEAGKIIIPMGKYLFCYTDTFRSYAIVDKSPEGIVGIDRQGRILYSVFIFDNGPDEPSNGLFRVKVSSKIGYADSATGKIVINPQFACAWPFENGMAKVAMECQSHSNGEHHYWTSDHWFFINKNGVRVDRPSSK
jgi:hypothetical protein